MSRIFIRNIPTRTKESELEHTFSKAGKITDMVMKINFAFIEYESDRQAFDAIKMFNEFNFQGNRLSVELAKTRTEKLYERLNEKCFECGEFGHWAKECQVFKRQRRQEKRKFNKIRRSPRRSFSRSVSVSNSPRSRSRSRSRNQSRSRSINSRAKK